MNMKHKEDIYKAMKPLLYVSRCLGLMPYPLLFSKQEIKSWPIIGAIYQLFIVILTITAYIAAIAFKADGYYQTKSHARILSSFFYWSSHSITAVICILLSRIYHEKIENILKKLTMTDPYSLSNPTAFYRRINHFVTAEVSIIYPLIMIISFYHSWTWVCMINTNFHFLGNFLFISINVTVTIQYINLVFFLYYKLKALNKCLKPVYSYDHKNKEIQKDKIILADTSFNNETDEQFKYDSHSIFNPIQKNRINIFFSLSSIRKLRQQQHFLTNIADNINSVYGFQMLWIILSYFIRLTANLYTPLYYAKNEANNVDNDPQAEMHILCVNLLWAALTSIELTCVSAICHVTKEEAKHTGILLQSLLLTETVGSPLSLEIRSFLEQVVHRPLQFTANGFFNIDLSFLCAFLSALVTYIIVYLQFN